MRERLQGLVGNDRRTRFLTAATAVAIVVAIVSFIALDPAEDTTAPDRYTISADRICLEAKRGIVEVEQQAGEGPRGVDVSALANDLLPIVATWHSQLQRLNAPADRVADVDRLEAALLEAEVKIAGLARVASRGDQSKTVASAKLADAASTEVEEAVANLGLPRCAEATIGITTTPN
jgi:hypothetical protein